MIAHINRIVINKLILFPALVSLPHLRFFLTGTSIGTKCKLGQKDIFERSRISFNKFRTSAGEVLKELRIISYVILFLIPYAHAMDLEMVHIKPKKFEKLLLAAQVSYLPLELRAKVAENIIDLTIHEYEKTKECIDQEKWKKYNLNELLLGIECAQEFHTLQKMCQHKIGGKKFLAQELFALPCNQRDVFMRMANRSCFKMEVEGNVALADYNIIRTMENEHITKGLKLAFLRKESNRNLRYGEILSLCGLLTGAISVVLSNTIKEESLVAWIVLLGIGFFPSSFCIFVLVQALMHPKCGDGHSIKNIIL